MSFQPKKMSFEFKGEQKRLLEVYEGTVMAVDTKTSLRTVGHTTYSHVPGSFVPKVDYETTLHASQLTEVWLQDDQGNEALLAPAPKLKMRAGHRIRVVKAHPGGASAGWAIQHNLTTGERIERTDSVYLSEKDEKQVKGEGPALKAFFIALVLAVLALMPTYSALSRPLGLEWSERHPDPESTGFCSRMPKSIPVMPSRSKDVKVAPTSCIVMVTKSAPESVQLTAKTAIGLVIFIALFAPLFLWLRKRHSKRAALARHYKGIVDQVNPKLREAFDSF